MIPRIASTTNIVPADCMTLVKAPDRHFCLLRSGLERRPVQNRSCKVWQEVTLNENVIKMISRNIVALLAGILASTASAQNVGMAHRPPTAPFSPISTWTCILRRFAFPFVTNKKVPSPVRKQGLKITDRPCPPYNLSVRMSDLYTAERLFEKGLNVQMFKCLSVCHLITHQRSTGFLAYQNILG